MRNLIKTNLDKTTNDNPQGNTRFNLKYFPQSDVLENSLDEMFPEQVREDKTVQRAKEILGDKFTTEDVKSMIASSEYLVNAWLAEYEKMIFNNKTLKELLRDL